MITDTAIDKMSARELLKTCKARYGMEKNFFFLKEPLIASDTFLKEPSRIDAPAFVLLVRLMNWNLMQRELKKSEQVRAGQLLDLNSARRLLDDEPAIKRFHDQVREPTVPFPQLPEDARTESPRLR